jgi:flavin reductase (DIM6/NTAB) family NADH-FMN oxidoreductase RutF
MEKVIWKPGNMLYPVPAVMVTCGRYAVPADEAGCNVLTIAWTGTVCSDPAMTYISVRPERHSYALLKETGEFVINLTSQALLPAADTCGVLSGRAVNKFQHCHLSLQKASAVSAPLLSDSPVNLECRVTQVLPLGSHDMFLAQIVAVDVSKNLLDEAGRFHLEQADLVAYSHGTYYALGEALGRFGYTVKKS